MAISSFALFCSELTRGLVQVFPLELDIRIIRIYEHADRGDFWDELVQQLQPLCSKINEIVSYAGCVPARAIETGHETRRDRVSSSREPVWPGLWASVDAQAPKLFSLARYA